MTGFNCVRCGQFETSDPYPEDEEDMCYPCGICVYEGCEECGNEILGDLQNCNQCGANLCESCPCSCDILEEVRDWARNRASPKEAASLKKILKSEELDDDEYWEPYVEALEELYRWCYGTVQEASESYAGMVQNIRLWQAVEEVSNESLSYILEKPWKYKYLAIRLLWNQEVDAHVGFMQDWLSPESISSLEDFNPERRNYEGNNISTSWYTEYPELKEVRDVFKPSWLPAEDQGGRWKEPYAFELFDAESLKQLADLTEDEFKEIVYYYNLGGDGAYDNVENALESTDWLHSRIEYFNKQGVDFLDRFYSRAFDVVDKLGQPGAGQHDRKSLQRHLDHVLGVKTQKSLEDDYKDWSAESYKPPASAVANAKRGLELRKEYGRGGLSPAEAKSQGIDSGVTRARKIASGKVSKHDVRRMSAFNRHRKNYRPEKKMSDGGPTAGTIAWLLWGGTSGVNWAKKKSAKMNAETFEADLMFKDWSEQEMMSHGDQDSFEDWLDHEIDKHGNVSLREWGDDEEKSHLERYGAEDFEAQEWDSWIHLTTQCSCGRTVEPYEYKLDENNKIVNVKYKCNCGGGRCRFRNYSFFCRNEAEYMGLCSHHAKCDRCNVSLKKDYEYFGRTEGHDDGFCNQCYDDTGRYGAETFEAQVDNNDRFWVDLTCSWCGKPYDGTEVLDEYEGQIVHYRCAASDNYKAEERYLQDYMVPADVHKIMEAAIHLQKLHEQHEGSYPEWWKSKLSVVASELDNLVDVLDYKVDHPEEFDAEDWGGDPEGMLAKALSRARMQSKQPRKPLKIEKLPHPDQKTLQDFEARGINKRTDNRNKKRESAVTYPVLSYQDMPQYRGYALDIGLKSKVLLLYTDLQKSGMGIDAVKTVDVYDPNGDQRFMMIVDERFDAEELSFQAVVIPQTSGYTEKAVATQMAIDMSEQQQKLVELQTLLKLKILSPEDAFAMMLGE